MTRKQKRNACLLALAVWIVLVVALVIKASMLAPRSAQSNTYDSQCLLEPQQYPLRDCKQ